MEQNEKSEGFAARPDVAMCQEKIGKQGKTAARMLCDGWLSCHVALGVLCNYFGCSQYVMVLCLEAFTSGTLP